MPIVRHEYLSKNKGTLVYMLHHSGFSMDKLIEKYVVMMFYIQK